MQDRILEFMRGLRAAGVPVSTAEGLDAFDAIGFLGISEKELFRQSLRSTLIKDKPSFEVFDELFPLYFSSSDAPLLNAFDDLTAGEQEMLEQALEGFDGQLDQLLEWLTSGEGPTAEELQAMMEQSGIRWAQNPSAAFWVTRRMMQQMGFGRLEEKLQELNQRLRELGMTDESVNRVMGVIEVNRQGLAENIAEQVKLRIAQQRAERPRDIQGPDLMNKSFGALSADEMTQLRREIQRIVNQLKTRAALRRKKKEKGKFDARNTIRQSMRYGGIPFEIKHKQKKLKPQIVLIFDVSRSMETMLQFLLYFVMTMQDQVSKLRCFAFYDNLGEVSDVVNRAHISEVDKLFGKIQQAIPGYLFRTNLGYSLDTFFTNHLDSVTGRSTVIVIGDGRNNYSDPRLDLVKDLNRRAKKLVWFTPENKQLWGTGDSDMDRYAELCDEVYLVRNLAQLSNAIDRVFVD
ncbi:MAG: hypothetical protein ACI9EW_001858 [Cellvibrionaceae bacterium]|jgi:uncharacterized protein with von Willebrand factor type A (vWA) domain